MTEFSLTARSAFSKKPDQHDGLTLDAIEPPAIVSLAIPNGGEEALTAALQGTFSIDLPDVGRTAASTRDAATFARLARDQLFALFTPPADDRPTAAIACALGDTAYLTDQSDSWATLRIAGKNCRAALERICPLDLHPAAFPPGTVARTVMEHLGVIIVCEAADTYLLLSARSSADDFLHAVETSARNVS